MSDNTKTEGFIVPLERLAQQFRKLPGVGKKTAYKYAYSVLDMSAEQVESFSKAITEAKSLITKCKICCNISDKEICHICSSTKRDKRTICVVEDPKDVAAIEKIPEYNGTFHVLGGVISPLDNKGPDKLSIKELLSRISTLLAENNEKIEIIIATNPTVEGDATAMYISRLIKPLGDITVTRLAYGMPVGGDLEYADDYTLFRAIEGRREM